MLTQYRARVKLASVAADNPPESVVDQRAIQFLPFVLRDAAYDSLMQLIEGTLEWRSENRLTALRTAGQTVRPRAPTSWEEYCHAFTFLFSAPNRISLSVGKGNRNDQASRRPVGRHILSQGHAGTYASPCGGRSISPSTSQPPRTHGTSF